MDSIKVTVEWSNKNFCGGWGCEGVGAIMATGKSLESFKAEFQSALDFHVAGMLADGEAVPEWLAQKDYCIEYDLTVSALLREAERYTTMAVISRESGINQKQLSHYASNLRSPREKQRRRIIESLHRIALSFMALC